MEEWPSLNRVRFPIALSCSSSTACGSSDSTAERLPSTALGPGRLTIKGSPRVTTTARDNGSHRRALQPFGAHSSARPGTSRSATSSVASGVTSAAIAPCRPWSAPGRWRRVAPAPEAATKSTPPHRANSRLYDRGADPPHNLPTAGPACRRAARSFVDTVSTATRIAITRAPFVRHRRASNASPISRP